MLVEAEHHLLAGGLVVGENADGATRLGHH